VTQTARSIGGPICFQIDRNRRFEAAALWHGIGSPSSALDRLLIIAWSVFL